VVDVRMGDEYIRDPVQNRRRKGTDVPEVKEQASFFANDPYQKTGVSEGAVQGSMMECRLHVHLSVL